MRSQIPGSVAVLVALWATAPGPATAQAPGNQDCMGCHAVADIARASGGSVHVEAAELQGSAHASLSCVSCHAAAAAIPHAEQLPAVRCRGCHAEAARKLAGSVHADAGAMMKAGARGAARSPSSSDSGCKACHGTHAVRPAAQADLDRCAWCHGQVVRDYQASAHGTKRAQGDTEVPACRECHGPTHEALPHGDARAPTSHAHLAATCAGCHADRERMGRRKIAIPEAAALYLKSVHGRSQDPGAATCNDCHQSHRMLRATDPGSSIYRANVPATCGRCHGQEAEDYRASVHGTALARGVTKAPMCTDCHGEHLIRGPRDPDSPVAASAVTATCSHCHEAPGIRETYGLPSGRLSTYRDSFHGLAARGGSPVAANCASCHGYHRILPSSDPQSAIHRENLPQTCGKCHPGAGERFAAGSVHVAMARPDQPVLYVVRLFYLWLIGLTIGGMLLHNALDLFSEFRRRLAEHLGVAATAVRGQTRAAGEAAGRWYERMTLSERLQHALLAASFSVLVYSGFALKFPESWLFAWLARLEGGYSWRSLIHRVAALVMVGVAIYHLVYLMGRRGRAMLAALAPRLEDLGHLGQNLAYMLGRRPHPPRFEHFGYIEKAEYWALVWGTGIMSVTGFLLWFENQSLQVLDKWVLDLATLVHYYEAWLAFLAIVVWHLYQTVLNPDVYPMSWTWITGRIREDQLRHEHPAEWEKIRAEERAAEAARQAEAEKAGGPPGEGPGPSPTSPT